MRRKEPGIVALWAPTVRCVAMKSVSYYVGLDVQRKSISYSIKRSGERLLAKVKSRRSGKRYWNGRRVWAARRSAVSRGLDFSTMDVRFLRCGEERHELRKAASSSFSAAEAERIMTHRHSFKPATGKLKSWEADAIMGVTNRTMRRWRERLNEHGY